MLRRYAPEIEIPLWARWALSFVVAIALLVGLVVFVDNNNANSVAPQNPAAVVRANREAETLVSQDQAPQVVTIATGTGGRDAVARAVQGDMTARINAGRSRGRWPGCGASPPAADRRTAAPPSRRGSTTTFSASSTLPPAVSRTAGTIRRRCPANIPVSRRCSG